MGATRSIAVRLGVLVAALAIAAAAAGVYHGYRTSRDLLVARAEEDMSAAVRVLTRSLRLVLQMAELDVRMVASMPGAARVLSTGPAATAPADATAAANELFEALLATRANYTQVRLISAAPGGPERVRVDRASKGTVRVLGDDLQEKGHYPYVYETLDRKPGEVYLSTIALNREEGVHGAQDRPTLRVAAPVAREDGTVLGVAVINIDMGSLFELLRADLPPSMHVYMANRLGDYLIHPDPRRTFGFDAGRRFLIQDDFPAAAAVISGPQDAAVGYGRDAPGERDDELVAAFARLPIGEPQEHRFMVLGLARTHAHIVDATRQIARSAWQQAAWAALAAAVVGALIARWVASPLRRMASAAQAFARGVPMADLPLARDDEIGQLARSLHDMQQRIQSHMGELRDSRANAERLAMHDALTGLPNRRLFIELLEGALATARRGQRIFALLLVNLDDFKAVNRDLGHATGDALLQAVADRLRHCVREVDAVARLGGDEFAVLCGGFDEPAHAEDIARKVLELIGQPVTIGDRPLHPAASMGVAMYPRDGQTADTLLEAADHALALAKAAGRSTWRLAPQRHAR